MRPCMQTQGDCAHCSWCGQRRWPWTEPCRILLFFSWNWGHVRESHLRTKEKITRLFFFSFDSPARPPNKCWVEVKSFSLILTANSSAVLLPACRMRDFHVNLLLERKQEKDCMFLTIAKPPVCQVICSFHKQLTRIGHEDTTSPRNAESFHVYLWQRSLLSMDKTEVTSATAANEDYTYAKHKWQAEHIWANFCMRDHLKAKMNESPTKTRSPIKASIKRRVSCTVWFVFGSQAGDGWSFCGRPSSQCFFFFWFSSFCIFFLEKKFVKSWIKLVRASQCWTTNALPMKMLLCHFE